MSLSARRVTEHVGSEVSISREELVSGARAEEIRALLVERGVVIFRDVPLGDDEQRAIARSLGDLRLGTVKKEGEEGLMKVTFDEKENPEYARFFFGSLLWHMDGTYEEYPPFATLLRPKVLHRRGGNTEFVSTYAAFEALEPADQREMEKLQVVHTMQAALFPAKRDCSPEEFALWCSYPERVHPLVWRHKSGRRSLVLSTSASHVVGMNAAESHDLLERLMRHATRPEFVYTHVWRPDDLLMWDNTGTMHRATPFDAESGRLLARFTLNGEEPITAVA